LIFLGNFKTSDLTPFSRYFQELIEMSSKSIRIPGADHPISISPTRGRVTIVASGKRIADTREALTLKEAAYPAVQYIPRTFYPGRG
jgi:uncharacterized protein (DUF427 family)